MNAAKCCKKDPAGVGLPFFQISVAHSSLVTCVSQIGRQTQAHTAIGSAVEVGELYGKLNSY